MKNLSADDVLQGEVGQDGGALAEHAHKLLGGVLDVAVAQDVDASVHLVALGIERHGHEARLVEHGGLGEHAHIVGAVEQLHDDVHVVHLHLDAEVEVLAARQLVEGVAGLQSARGQQQVVA